MDCSRQRTYRQIDAKATGMRIVALGAQHGYSVSQLADILHVTPQAISAWRRGVCVPKVETLDILADLFGVDIGNILQYKSQA